MFETENSRTDWPQTITITVAVAFLIVLIPAAAIGLFFMLAGIEC